jgi:leader peptidase (prepilin peptidase)/N-methyltransferase
MDVARPIVAAMVFFFAGWAAGSFQHFLYREPQFRRDFARGRKAVAIRGGSGLAAAVVGAVAFRGGHYDFGPALLTGLFGLVLVVLSSTDFERRRIPDRLTYPALLAAIVFCWAWPDRDVGAILAGLGFAAAVGVAVFILGVLLGGAVGGLGLGDVKLMILIGALLGWPATMYALFVGMILGGVPAAFLLVTRRSRTFSYGPYLAAGAIIGLLWPDRYM